MSRLRAEVEELLEECTSYCLDDDDDRAAVARLVVRWARRRERDLLDRAAELLQSMRRLVDEAHGGGD